MSLPAYEDLVDLWINLQSLRPEMQHHIQAGIDLINEKYAVLARRSRIYSLAIGAWFLGFFLISFLINPLSLYW